MSSNQQLQMLLRIAKDYGFFIALDKNSHYVLSTHKNVCVGLEKIVVIPKDIDLAPPKEIAKIINTIKRNGKKTG
jgi:hypothetical protein